MKKLLTFLVTFGLVFGTYGIASAAGSATLDFSPDTKSVATGETFNLDVMIDPNGESLDTVRVVVSYPASMLEVTSYSLGSVFDTASPGNSINNATGSLSQGAFKTGGGVTSSGKVGTITFRALSAGTASIAFGTTSRAISAGVEKLSITGSGSASVTITGDAVTGEATSTTVLTTEQIAIGDFGAITGYSPSSDLDWLAISYMVSGYSGERELAQEQAALAKYVSVFGATPSTSYQWNVIAAIAYSGAILDWDGAAEAVVEAPVAVEVPVAEASLEQQALVYFGAFYGFMPSTSNDWDALHCFAYGGCQGDPQDVDAEGSALVVFGAKYGTMPSTSIEWNVVHTLAYTEFLTTEEPAAEEAVAEEVPAVEEEDVEEVAAVELTPTELAIGTFGTLAGYLPSSDADWTAIDIIVNGYAGERDLQTETAAMDTFISTFGAVPASTTDWNVVAAIAYSGAF